jgi:hypothetical protein
MENAEKIFHYAIKCKIQFFNWLGFGSKKKMKKSEKNVRKNLQN